MQHEVTKSRDTIYNIELPMVGTSGGIQGVCMGSCKPILGVS